MTLNKRGEEKSFLYGNSLRTCNESRKPSNQNIAQRYLANDSTICIKNSGMVCFSILQKYEHILSQFCYHLILVNILMILTFSFRMYDFVLSDWILRIMVTGKFRFCCNLFKTYTCFLPFYITFIRSGINLDNGKVLSNFFMLKVIRLLLKFRACMETCISVRCNSETEHGWTHKKNFSSPSFWRLKDLETQN